jgi:hypothetical protein
MLRFLGEISVLLFTMTTVGMSNPSDTGAIDPCVFAFTTECHLATGCARLDGLMAYCGSQKRIAIYWVEPDACREGGPCVLPSDFILVGEVVHYWLCGQPEPRIVDMRTIDSVPLLPRQGSTDAVVRSALAIVSLVQRHGDDADVPLQIRTFFQNGRCQSKYTCRAVPDQQNSGPDCLTTCDEQILNSPPCGREYSKEAQTNGGFVWKLCKGDGQPLVSVTVEPLRDREAVLLDGVFAVSSLGEWRLVPAPYRTYCSFYQDYSRLVHTPDVLCASKSLFDRIESYLGTNAVPIRVVGALDRLWLKTALMTHDAHRVSKAAEAITMWLCRGDSVPKGQALFELAATVEPITKEYPDQAEQLLGPLVARMVAYVGEEAAPALERLIPTIDANKWCLYARLAVGQVRALGLSNKERIDALVARFDSLSSSLRLDADEPCEVVTTVKQYLSQLDAAPPRGALDVNDLRIILQRGLAERFKEDGPDARNRVIEEVMRLIRLIAGEGPFCGDADALVASIDRFSGLYLEVERTKQPIDSALATLLSLAFCDISTPQDHTVLSSQFHGLCVQMGLQIEATLERNGLAAVATRQDIDDTVSRYEREFAGYTDDPLWPAFKFPFTTREKARLTYRVRGSVARLAPFLAEMSLKLKYGGKAGDLKGEVLSEISRTAEQLLVAAAFVRTPPYPGVVSQYRANHGFAVTLTPTLYKDVDRARRTFISMKYFHLGHRMEDVVKQERELAFPAATSAGDDVALR